MVLVRRLLVLFFVFGALNSIQAQDINSSTFAVNRVGLNGIDELSKLLSDPEVRIEEKSLAVSRLGELATYLKYDKSVAPSRLYTPLLNALVPQQQADHHVLRYAACEALSKFGQLDGTAPLVAALGKVLQNPEEHEEVRKAAARSLSAFVNDSTLASEQLIGTLNAEMSNGPQANNIGVATASIRSLGGLRDKRAFVPLMRVIKSNFPTHTKREAQKALENIRWD